jgi:hypothetical protein
MHASIGFPSGVTKNVNLWEHYEHYCNVHFSKLESNNFLNHRICFLNFSSICSIEFILSFMELTMSVLICKIENEAYFIILAFLMLNDARVMCQIYQRQEVDKKYIIPTRFLIHEE